MQVVDTVQVHVFSVPCKCRLPHTEVEVCSVDSFDLYVVFIVDRVQNRSETAYIPDVLVPIGQTAGDICSINGLVEGDILPVFSLQLIEVPMSRGPVSKIKRAVKLILFWE